MVISETETRMEKRSRIFEGLTSRKIVFKGDARGISTPSNLPYSPKKTTWKGKKAVTTGQLQAEVKKKRVKQMAMKGRLGLMFSISTDFFFTEQSGEEFSFGFDKLSFLRFLLNIYLRGVILWPFFT